ncbi:MAG: hypothetical protein ACI9O0_000755 [Paracoccaceae bacterium]|jgi:hypothetical protein
MGLAHRPDPKSILRVCAPVIGAVGWHIGFKCADRPYILGFNIKLQ